MSISLQISANFCSLSLGCLSILTCSCHVTIPESQNGPPLTPGAQKGLTIVTRNGSQPAIAIPTGCFGSNALIFRAILGSQMIRDHRSARKMDARGSCQKKPRLPKFRGFQGQLIVQYPISLLHAAYLGDIENSNFDLVAN